MSLFFCGVGWFITFSYRKIALPLLPNPLPFFCPILPGWVVTLRHPSKGGPVGTSSDDGIRRDPSRLRVVGLKLALCELVGQQTEETVVETFLIYY